MQPTTTIHVMRHGEVDNPHGLLYGRLPGFGLTPLGHAMARTVAQSFAQRGADLTYIVTSPLQRAKESGAPTHELFDIEMDEDERLIEAGNSFEGEAINENRWLLAAPKNWVRYRNPFRPSWGEPYREQAARMKEAIRSALHHSYGHEGLVVSHQLPIWCLRLFIEGRPYAHLPGSRECALASLTSLTFSGTTLVGIQYGEPAHDLVAHAADMVPGTSQAAMKKAEEK